MAKKDVTVVSPPMILRFCSGSLTPGELTEKELAHIAMGQRHVVIAACLHGLWKAIARLRLTRAGAS